MSTALDKADSSCDALRQAAGFSAIGPITTNSTAGHPHCKPTWRRISERRNHP